jgi:hypothetical protein
MSICSRKQDVAFSLEPLFPHPVDEQTQPERLGSYLEAPLELVSGHLLIGAITPEIGTARPRQIRREIVTGIGFFA